MRKETLIGKISQIIGPVVDVRFDGGIPQIHEKLVVKGKGGVVLEVLSHVGGSTVRCIALQATEGLSRGTDVEATGASITVPVGDGTLGRVMNVLG